jgi:hypothetical protein
MKSIATITEQCATAATVTRIHTRTRQRTVRKTLTKNRTSIRTLGGAVLNQIDTFAGLHFQRDPECDSIDVNIFI